MKNAILLCACSLSLLSPNQVDRTINYLSSSGYENIMKNGDHSLEGFGSVTAELEELFEKEGKGRTVRDYKVGIKRNNEVLYCSESESEIYFYCYFSKPEDFRRYDSISLSTYSGPVADWADIYNNNQLEWRDFSITSVSYDETKTLVKYKVNDLYINKDIDHVYLFRQIYSRAHKDEINYVLKVGALYEYNAERDYTSWTSEETVTIKNKVVAYQLYPFTDLKHEENTYSTIFQRLYTGFSITDVPGEEEILNLIDVTLQYKPTYYGGYTDIPLNYYSPEVGALFSWNCAKEFDEAIGDVDLYDHLEKSICYREYEEPIKQKTVEHEVIEVTYEEFDFEAFHGGIKFNPVKFATEENTLRYDTIESKEQVDQSILEKNPELKKCDWFVSFENRPIGAMSHFQTSRWDGAYYSEVRSKGNIFVGVDQSSEFQNGFTEWWIGTTVPEITKSYCDSNIKFDESSEHKGMMIKADDVSIINLTYKTETGAHRAIAVDTYDDVIGQIPIQDDSTASDFEKWWDSFVAGLTSARNVLKWILAGVFGVILILFIVKFTYYLVGIFKRPVVKVKAKKSFKKKK